MLRFIQDKNHSSVIRVSAESAWEFRVLGGLVACVRRAARAYLVLEKKGFATEGRVIVRGALEHALTAQWAYLTPGGVSRLETSLLMNRHNYAKTSVSDYDGPEWAALLAALDQRIPRDEQNPDRRAKGLPKLTGEGGILDELDYTGYFKRAMTVLSRVVHVSDEAVTDYFVETDDETYVADSPEPRFSDDVFHTLATACCLSGWVIARLEDDEYELSAMRRQGVLWRLDMHLPEHRRRFPTERE